MDVSHPVAIKMFQMGCKSQVKVLLAFQTYIELCEAYVLKNVDYHFNEKLDMIYISSKDTAEGKTKKYIPVNVSESTSMAVISEWQEVLSDGDPNIELYIVLRDGSTTGVYYKLSGGLAAPPSLEAAQVRKSQNDSKEFARIEIVKARHRLYSQAKESDKDPVSTS